MKLVWQCVNCSPEAKAEEQKIKQDIQQRLALLAQDQKEVFVHIPGSPRCHTSFCMKCQAVTPHFEVNVDKFKPWLSGKGCIWGRL